MDTTLYYWVVSLADGFLASFKDPRPAWRHADALTIMTTNEHAVVVKPTARPSLR